MKRFLITIISIFATSNLAIAGDWILRTTKDNMTDQPSKEVFVTSPGGEKFTIIRRSDEKVWGYIQLSGINQFSVNERLMLRVDKNKPHEINEDLQNLTKRLGNPIGSWEWNPNLIGFLIWHGKINEGCGIIKELFDGKKMIIRYHPNKSTIRDIEFPLTGNRKAISDALSLDLSNCPAQ